MVQTIATAVSGVRTDTATRQSHTVPVGMTTRTACKLWVLAEKLYPNARRSCAQACNLARSVVMKRYFFGAVFFDFGTFRSVRFLMIASPAVAVCPLLSIAAI